MSLNTVRDRIRTQLESAIGDTDPLSVTASSVKLAGLRRRVRSRLQDAGADTWANADIDEAIRAALEEYSKARPQHKLSSVAISTAGREIDISPLSDLMQVEKIWWDYDSSDITYPPNYRRFEVWPGSILYVNDREEPQSGDTVRVWYTAQHTLTGLDGQTATTIPIEDEGLIATGAVANAAEARTIEATEDVTVSEKTPGYIAEFAATQRDAFEAQLKTKHRKPAYDQGDIDEATRWALYRISEVKPHRAITTITLPADGREVDVSSIDYLNIERVWLDYDSSDPAYAPRWADFEIWPGDILFINEPTEPSSGDIIRIWYTTEHILSSLDSAATTTLTDREINTLVIGASGFCAQEKGQEVEAEITPWGTKGKKLLDWAEARLGEFEAALTRIARTEGVKHSGIAKSPPLDRWDDEWA